MELIQIKKRSTSQIYVARSGAANLNAFISTVSSLSNDLGDLINEHNDKILSAFSGLCKGTDDDLLLDSTKDAIQNGIDGRSVLVDRDSDEDSNEWEYSTEITRPLTIKESLQKIYDALSTRIDSIVVDSPEVISEYTKTYIGEEAFDNTVSSSPTSMDGRLSALENWQSGVSSSDLDDTAVLFGDGSSTPDSDASNFNYDFSTKTLEVNGVIKHHDGVQSNAGNTKGAGASDLQCSRTAVTQVASGVNSFIAGKENTASGNSSVAMNNGNTVTGANSFAINQSNESNAINTFSHGRETNNTIKNARAFGPGKISTVGDCQSYEIPLKASTTDATATTMSTDTDTTLIETLNDTAYLIVAHVVGRSTTTNKSCAYIVKAAAVQAANPATLIISGLTVETLLEDDAALDITIVANTVSGSINIQVTGLVAESFNWSGYANIVLIIS